MPRLNIQMDNETIRKIHEAEMPHGLRDRFIRNLISLVFASGIDPSHIAVAKEGEFELVKKEK